MDRAPDTLLQELDELVTHLDAAEAKHAADVAESAEAWRESARNLAHYVALRRRDLRPLQARLRALGLSSLGRSEAHVLPSVRAVHAIVARLAGGADALVEIPAGAPQLAEHTDALFGAPRAGRDVRIMVTMPSEAADDPELVRALVAAGMDVMRINAAHDDAPRWRRMAAHLRAANQALGARCRVQVDLPGPKLRTGAFVPGPRVIHWKPRRDARGAVVEPARVRLATPGAVAGAAPTVWVDAAWLAPLAVGDRVTVHDLRGKKRHLEIVARDETGAWAVATQSAYVGPESTLVGAGVETRPLDVPPLPGEAHVAPGDLVRLVGPDVLGRAAAEGQPALIPCTVPEALAAVRPGQQIHFDDGKLGGTITTAGEGAALARVTEGPPGGARLAADKGINLPDTVLPLPALGARDLEALDVACEVADLVGQSFARSAHDVAALHHELARRGATSLGVILKVETRHGFENLPAMLLAAMRRPPFGVMIARGDLAVECGFARLAEIQEEMLCLCEAAHAPVVWATQVLDSAARTGAPSRAEVTDAAVGERAECVMLNKGPFIVQAVQTLDDILRRMQSHQRKKTALFRRLRSFGA